MRSVIAVTILLTASACSATVIVTPPPNVVFGATASSSLSRASILPSASGVVLLSSVARYPAPTVLEITGEARNDGPSAHHVKIVATLYAKDGSAVTNDDGLTEPSTLQPGERAPFKIIVLSPPANVDSYRLTLSLD